MRVLILDNYDSFTWNLAQCVGEMGARPLVHRNDAFSLDGLRELDPGRIIISPGPGRPDKAGWFGICGDVIRRLGPTVPILGVCLGHLGIISELGGRIVTAPQPRHGKTSPVTHDARGCFAGLPPRIEVMRYHSLVGEETSLPADLVPTSHSDDGVLMGVRHVAWPLEGLQFHPESVGTRDGAAMIRNFLECQQAVEKPANGRAPSVSPTR